MSNDTWTLIHAERDALADDLQTLTAAQWQTRSLCENWTVQQVVAHLVGTSTSTKVGFFTNLAKSGFNFGAMTGKHVARYSQGSPADTLAAFVASAHSRTSPPGPVQSWLGEAIIHGEDIRRPLGINRDYPTDTVRVVADFYKGSNMIIGAKKRIAGVTLRATDTQWSTGTGPVVEGPLMALLMAMTGRPAFLDDVSGDGLDEFRKRF